LQSAKTQPAYNQYDELVIRLSLTSDDDELILLTTGDELDDELDDEGEPITGGITGDGLLGSMISPNSAEVVTVYSFGYSSTKFLL
jgi:hypothetical protein